VEFVNDRQMQIPRFTAPLTEGGSQSLSKFAPSIRILGNSFSSRPSTPSTVLRTPAAPGLTISLTSDRAIVSWPTSASGFFIEASQDLSGGSWSPVPFGLIAKESTTTNSLDGQNHFYRLHKN